MMMTMIIDNSWLHKVFSILPMSQNNRSIDLVKSEKQLTDLVQLEVEK